MRHVLKYGIGRVLMALLLICFTPLVAAANSLEAVPQVGTPGIFATVGLMGLGIGAVITLKAKDATGNKKTFMVDPEKPAEGLDTIEQFAELKAEETAGPIREQLTAAQNEGKALRDILVGEILRIRKLSAPKGADGKDQFDLEGEKKYLEGLPAERLKMEFDRLPVKREEIDVKPVTTNAAPVDPNDPYKVAMA